MSLYRSLDAARQETRILLITNTEPLEFEFDYASMVDDQLEEFDAVSWCWGDTSAANQKQITIGKHTTSVPANAYEVLVELCVAQNRRRIWIDAVCINQNDNAEKSQQVAMMDTIYKTATMTLVWLGKDNDTAKRAMEALQSIADWRQIRLPLGPYVPEDSTFIDERQSDPFPVETDWDALSSFFSAAWFTRMWIIQEVVLSKHVHVFKGGCEICWKQLIQITHYIQHNPAETRLSESGKWGAANAVSLGRMQGASLQPLHLLDSSPNYGATDPKDRIFALYGLLKADTQSTMHMAFLPDYDSRLVDVYTKATRAAIISSVRSGLLLHAQSLVRRLGCEHGDADFPSWVPRYHFTKDRFRGSYRPLSYSYTNQAGIKAQAIKVDTNTPSNILRIAGVVMDTLSTTFEPLSPSLSDKRSSREPCGSIWCRNSPCKEHKEAILTIISQLWHAAIAANPKITLPDLATMLRMTLQGGPDQESHSIGCDCESNGHEGFQQLVNNFWPTTRNAPIEREVIRKEKQLSSYHSALDDEYSSDSEPDHESDTVNPGNNVQVGYFWRSIVQQHANRRFFLAESGRIGIAAPQSQAGDKVCLLSGLEIALVLRQVDDHWILIGDAYLSGPMNDEFVDKLNSGAEQWFDLR